MQNRARSLPAAPKQRVDAGCFVQAGGGEILMGNRSIKDVLNAHTIEEVDFWWSGPEILCACPGGPPPFGCRCTEYRFARANALLAKLSIISILKGKANARLFY